MSDQLASPHLECHWPFDWHPNGGVSLSKSGAKARCHKKLFPVDA
jgi:hypothetical protein